MALTEFQRAVCRLIAQNRVALGESYVAGGAALNTVIGAPRLSRDVDLFHDTDEALGASWEADRGLLASHGYSIDVVLERPTFVEAKVAKVGDSVLMQWMRDSAFRFFPLIWNDDLGLTLHPFDLATNKVLALVGRLEVRDWVDLIMCHERLQRLGYLAWGACGKDSGFSPKSILENARRSGHYSADEVSELSFEGPTPDAQQLARSWQAMLAEASEIVALLPADEAGRCVLDPSGGLFSGSPDEAIRAIESGSLRFRAGSIRGVLPTIRR
jgi:hypothetical protein